MEPKRILDLRLRLILLRALIAGFGLSMVGRVAAQTFTNHYNFPVSAQGGSPLASLVISTNTLYGTDENGGPNGNGTVFKVNTDGTGFTNLHIFSATSGPSSTNGDGADPHAGLLLSSGTLYGTTFNGGSNGSGTVFKVNIDGSGFTNLHSFTATFGPNSTNGDGANPMAGLDLSGNTLYGAASSGGAHGSGTVYKVNTDGTGFTTMHSLNSLTDGTEPAATLVLAGSTLFGTALGGGGAFGGTVFKINTDDSGFSNVYNGIQYGSQGGQPQGMILSGQTLYGTLHVGAAGSAGGTVFKLNTNGAGFTNLCSFAGLTNGAGPNGGLILSGNTLYGTAVAGGANGNGTVFKVNTDGTGFAGLYNFTTLQNAVSNTDGALPRAGLILSGGSVYGTASAGGAAGNGTVFSFSLGPALTIILSGTNAILSWPANAGVFDYSGFTLQSTTNPVALAVWTTVSPPPALVNGQNTVTNPISGTEQFYRLSQ